MIATSNSSLTAAAAAVTTQLDAILTPLHVLTSVCVVCRECAPVAALEHVTTSIDAFLWPSLRAQKTLEDAVATDCIYVLRRRLAEETAVIESVQDKQQRQQRQFYVGLQVTKAALCAVQQRNPNFRRVLECLRSLDPHAVGVDEVVTEAAAAHDLELLEWLHVACPPLDLDLIDSSAAAARAAGNGDIDVLEWLIANRWSPLSKVPVADAVANRQMSVLHWLETNDAVQVFIDAHAVSKAAELGDLEMLEWLYARPREESATRVGNGAASGGHVHVLEWLFAHHPDDTQCSLRGYTSSARNGHLDVLQWLYTYYPKRYWKQSAEAATKAGHLAVLQFLTEKRDANDSIGKLGALAAVGGDMEVIRFVCESLMEHGTKLPFRMIQGAVKAGDMEMVKWLHEEHNAIVSTLDVANLAILHDHLPVLEYILQFRTYPATWMIEIAARNNRMDILEWLHAKISEPKSQLRGHAQGLDRWRVAKDRSNVADSGRYSLPIDSASYNGNLEIIQWLDANGYSECSTRAMDSAAANGHLDVVKWLHEHRTEGCTTNAMQQAAMEGHLEVVRWLHEHRSEGCTANTFRLVVRDGNARVVEFLLQHRSEDCIDAAGRDAARWCNDVEVLHVLYTYRREMVDLERVRARANALRNAAMQRWLRLVTTSD